MQHTLTVHQAELSVFSKGLEAVIRKLVRFAVGNISLVKLQEMVSHLFVEEVEARLAAKNRPATRHKNGATRAPFLYVD